MFFPSMYPRSRRPCRNAPCGREHAARGAVHIRSLSRGLCVGCAWAGTLERREKAKRKEASAKRKMPDVVSHMLFPISCTGMFATMRLAVNASNHLVRPVQHGLWNRQAELPGGCFRLMHEFKFHGCSTGARRIRDLAEGKFAVILQVLRGVSRFLRQDEVLNHAFFHRAPANVLDALGDIVTQDHVIRVERRVAALGTSAHLF